MRAYHAMPPEEVESALGTDARLGLSGDEAGRRRVRHGPNVLQAVQRVRWWQVLGRQFRDVLIVILVLAAALSVAIGEWADAATIMAIVLLNGVLGFFQEWKAEQALEALQQMLAPTARVTRDGVERQIPASELVPGDLIHLEIGDRVPADVRLAREFNLKVDESSLTGESTSVSKSVVAIGPDLALAERTSMAWMGTSVTNGRASGYVTATGMDTEFGRIAHLTQTVGQETTPLQRQLAKLGRQLGIFAVGVSASVAAVGIVLGKPILEMIMTGVSLAVAVVPEGLPAVVTITLGLGVRAMVRHRALMRRLQAAETLGAASVICTDKTGTLTRNEMTVQRVWTAAGEVGVTGIGYEPRGGFETNGAALDPASRPDVMAVLQTGLRCNHAKLLKESGRWRQLGEPTEAALLVAAHKAGLEPDDDDDRDVTEFSFNSTRKRMTVIVDGADGMVAHVKGAPEVLLPRCSRILDAAGERPLDEATRRAVEDAYVAMASDGLRTLALARRAIGAECRLQEDDVENDLTLLGVVGMLDPPRAEVPAAIDLAQRAGMRVVMITGDAAPTAQAVGRRVGLAADTAILGTQLSEMDDDAVLAALAQGAVFARTAPEHKLRIVTLLQELGSVVGMTGDGVNDAPALRKADIGIAMGIRGTDVARGASDMVLTDDNFASIINAVQEGRRQFDNIRKFVGYLLSSNTGEIVAIFLNIILGGPLILLPVQILWMNLLTDGLVAVALGLEPVERDAMNRPPRPRRQAVLDRAGVTRTLIYGGYVGLVTLWLFHHYLGRLGPESVAVAQTVAFTGIIVVEKMNVLNFRSLTSPLSTIGFFRNPWLLAALVFTLGLQVCAVYVPFLQSALHTVPLGWNDWLLMFLVAAPILVFAELFKWLSARRVARGGRSQKGLGGSALAGL